MTREQFIVSTVAGFDAQATAAERFVQLERDAANSADASGDGWMVELHDDLSMDHAAIARLYRDRANTWRGLLAEET